MATGSKGVEVWRGGVNAWECDEMGHMNTRFYVARCMEGLRALLALSGIPVAAGSAPRVREMHIRFHREAQVATSLHMEGGFARIDASQAVAVFVLRHSLKDAIAATFRVVLGPPASGAWSDPETAPAFATPPEAQPRGVDPEYRPPARPDLANHLRIALGNLGDAECDSTGRMMPQKFIGSVSDGIRRLTSPLREIVVEHAAERPEHFGGAVLEFRILHLDWPMAGECFEIRSAFRRADARTMLLEHWMADPHSGRLFGYMESVAVVFDIDKRKIVPISDAAQAALQPLMTAT